MVSEVMATVGPANCPCADLIPVKRKRPQAAATLAVVRILMFRMFIIIFFFWFVSYCSFGFLCFREQGPLPVIRARNANLQGKIEMRRASPPPERGCREPQQFRTPKALG